MGGNVVPPNPLRETKVSLKPFLYKYYFRRRGLGGTTFPLKEGFLRETLVSLTSTNSVSWQYISIRVHRLSTTYIKVLQTPFVRK